MHSLLNKTIKIKTLVSASMLVSLSATTALAQTVPSSVNPANVEKRFERPDTSAPASQPRLTTTQPSTLPKKEQEKLAKQRFVLRQVNIQGNTVFSEADLKFAYADMIGKEISMLDAQGVARRITDFYRDRGYVLSQAVAPAQNTKDGSLKISVIEGYINNVIIQGDIKQNSYRKILESYAQGLKSKRPIRTADMERYLLLMDDLPGATARGVVRPSTTQVGAADLVVTLSHQTWEGSYTLDNRGSKFIGPYQHSTTLAANSILGMYDRTLLRFITTSPTKELRFFDLQHEEQIGDEGTRLVLTGSYGHTEPGDTLKSLDVRGDSYFLQAKVLHPFIRSRSENLVGRAIVDARNTSTDVFVNTNLSKDKLRVVRLGGTYDFADHLFGVNLIDAEISQGLDVFGASDSSDPVSRTNADGKFTKVNLDLTRTQPLPGNFSLYTSATGQYAFDELLPAEQFSLGGANFGRAYDPAELSGDHGAAGKIELRYGNMMDDPILKTYQVYGFYDIGRVWVRNGGPNTDKSLASAGLGVRTNFSDFLSANVEVADPLTRPASNQGGHGHAPRLFFSVTGRF